MKASEKSKSMIFTSVTYNPASFNLAFNPSTKPSEINVRFVTDSSAVYDEEIAFNTSLTAGITNTVS